MNPLSIILWSVLLSCASTALTNILRALPLIRDWVFEMKKPWACNVCMPIYTCAVLAVAAVLQEPQLLSTICAAYLPAYLLSNISLDALARPPAGRLPSFDGDADHDERRPN